MTHVTADRVRDTSTTSGTGSLTLSGTAPTGYQAFASVMATNDTCHYCAVDTTTGAWEVGYGTLTASTTLARTKVLASSNSGSAVSFAANSKDVFITVPASRMRSLSSGAAYGIDSIELFNEAFGASTAWDYEFDGFSTSIPSGWSWDNQGTSTYQERLGAGAIYPQNTGSQVWRHITQPLTGAPSTWNLYAKIGYTLDGSMMGGITLKESSSGKFVTYCMVHGGNIGVFTWTNNTTYSGQLVQLSIAGGYLYPPAYLRVTKNSSTSYDFSHSYDGVCWYTDLAANNITTFCTPDTIGIGIDCDAAQCHIAAHWFRLR